MPSNEATCRAVAEAQKTFDRVMKAKHPDYVHDVEEAVKLHRARLAAEYADSDPTDTKDLIVDRRKLGDDMQVFNAPVTRMRDYSEPRPSVTTEVDEDTLHAWIKLSGLGQDTARKQLSEVIGRVGKKEMLRRMQAVAESKKDTWPDLQCPYVPLRQSKPTTFSDEEMREWANMNKITVEEMDLRIKAAQRAGTLDYLRPWTAPARPPKPTPPGIVKMGMVSRNVQPCELLYKEHVEVGAFEFSSGAWVTVYVQPFWFPKTTIKNILKTFDGELEYVHSHIEGHWWSGYTITGYFFDKPSAERAATYIRQKACWDGYIEHQSPRPSPGPPRGSGGLSPPVSMLQ